MTCIFHLNSLNIHRSISQKKLDSANFGRESCLFLRFFVFSEHLQHVAEMRARNRLKNARVGGDPKNNVSGWWLGHPSEKYLSIGIIVPNIWENKKCSKPPTRYGVSVSTLYTSPSPEGHVMRTESQQRAKDGIAEFGKVLHLG